MTAAFWLHRPHDDWAPLTEGAARRRVPRHTVLHLEGAPIQTVGVLLEGRVRLVSHGACGSERHIAVVGAPGLFGDCGVWDAGRHQTAAVASTDLLCAEVPAARFRQALLQTPALMGQALAFAEQRFQVMLAHHALLGTASALQRVAFALHGLSGLHGEPHALGLRITMRFTQEEMACICSLSRVSVSHAMAALCGRGLLVRRGACTIVRDAQALHRLASGG